MEHFDYAKLGHFKIEKYVSFQKQFSLFSWY